MINTVNLSLNSKVDLKEEYKLNRLLDYLHCREFTKYRAITNGSIKMIPMATFHVALTHKTILLPNIQNISSVIIETNLPLNSKDGLKQF